MKAPARPLGLDVAAGRAERPHGAVPLGFREREDGTVERDPEELEAVALILRRRRAGDSFRTIAAELTKKGHATKRGGSWQASTVRAVWTRRARYVGVLDGAVELRLLRAGRDW